jgi:protoporphyrinogen oxidase
MEKKVVIIGAGPAGLTAAYLLAKANVSVTVIEADPDYVGGIARTVTYNGYHFDIGGHRFFSKSTEVEAFWTEILPDDMLERPRSSRIFYNKKFFAYPLNFTEVLSKLGIIESGLCFLSYLKAKIFPIKKVVSFSDWVINHFGKRLFCMFFKTYTEKVWGMPCEQISADWAAQRIKGLSFFSAVINSLKPRKKSRKNKTIKTLIESFRYPRKGPGMLWEVCAEKIIAAGGQIIMGHQVIGCQLDKANQRWHVTYKNASNKSFVVEAIDVISSAPLRELVTEYLCPHVSAAALQAALSLKYRDFLIVALILKDKNSFSDNWIYIHDASVDVGRIQNFKSWSPEMLPNDNTVCYGMEYFCFDNEALWNSDDAVLLQKAKEDLAKIGLATVDEVMDGCVVRQSKAYPVYDDAYKEHVEIIKHELQNNFPGLHLIGRNGMHKYNNQDHAMMTAMLTVKNILAGEVLFDVWNVNQDAEYHEAGEVGKSEMELGLRAVPRKIETVL